VIDHRAFLSASFCLALACSLIPTASAQEIRFDGSTFRVVSWDDAARAADLSAEDQVRLFAVYVDVTGGNAGGALPAVSGSYRVEEGVLVFEPRYPPAPGVSYRVVVDPGAVDLSGSSSTLTFDVARPERPPTVVDQVYPSTDVLPENQLKLYIHFSAAMSRGEAYRNIRLLDADGVEVQLAFLELDQELWTRDFRRFTILFDPGRIKTGLAPNLEAGRALVPGRTYTLVIGSEWRDANSQPLASEYRKTFRAGPFDDVAPDISTWRLGVPDVGTTDPVTVTFPEPMDHGLLDGLIVIVNARGDALEGGMEIGNEETRWLFVPASPWEAGNYELVAGTELEDLAGNALNGLFEVDVFEVDQTGTVPETESLPFSITPR
jgi:hypothetical protein